MVLIGIGLCTIGIGIIGYDILIATNRSGIPKWIPKGRPAGTYEINMEDWKFSEN